MRDIKGCVFSIYMYFMSCVSVDLFYSELIAK